MVIAKSDLQDKDGVKSTMNRNLEPLKNKLATFNNSTELKFKKNPIKTFVKKLFYNQGLIVSKYPLPFIIIPFIITSALSCGLLMIKMDYNLSSMVTPSNAYSNYESRVFLDFFQEEGGLFYFTLGVNAKDNGSLLREDYRKDVLALYKYLLYNYSITVDKEQYTFHELRVNHTDDNLLVTTVLQNFNKSKTLFKFTYPVLEFNEEKYFIGDVMRRVTIDQTTMTVSEMNMVWFYFNSAQVNKTHANLLTTWALSFLKHPKANVFPKLNYYYWSNDAAGAEMMRNCVVATPFVVLAFGVVIVFAFIVSSTKNPVTSKSWEALTSIIAVLLASGSGFGVVCYLGYPFVATSVVVPILVLALGMDVTYITLRNWRICSPYSPPNIRLAETLEESGPSVVITVLTNVLSAGIGCVTNIMGMYIFCLILSISLMVLFILQITFFPAFIAYSAKREVANKHGWLIWLTVKNKVITVQSNGPDVTATATAYTYFDWWYTCSKYLAKFICTTYCRVLVTVIMIAYWASSIYCCYQMKIGLAPSKFFLPDSPLLETITSEEDITNAGRFLYIMVSNPPNFDDQSEYKSFLKMVDDFESFSPCIGTNATALWLRQYENYMSFVNSDSKAGFYDNLESFLSTYQRWAHYIKTEKLNNSMVIKNFLFTVVYHRTYNWNTRNSYTYMWRDIASRYPNFNVSSWYEDNFNFVTDQLASLPSNTIQDLLITGLCMAIVCIMFIPNIFNTLCAIVTVFSINVGTFGYLTAWDVALDPVSVTSLLISIGYSVDFTSHISYHYYSCRGETHEEKVASALSSIGLPMLESGFSTLLCVACMCFVPSYVELVFFKTILLVIVLGLLHGLIILPTYLAWIPLNCLNKLFMKKQKVDNEIVAEKKPDIVKHTEDVL